MHFDLASYALGFFSAFVSSAVVGLLAFRFARPRLIEDPQPPAPAGAPETGSGERRRFRQEFYDIEGAPGGRG